MVKIGVPRANIERQRAINAAKVFHLPDFDDVRQEPKMAIPVYDAGVSRAVQPVYDRSPAPPRMMTQGWLALMEERAPHLQPQEQQGEA